jgi:hypothetical protein
MIPAICGAVIVPYGSFLRFLATCGCMQGRDFFQENCIGARCKRLTEWFGGGVLSFFSLLSFIMLAAVVIEIWINDSGYSILATLLLSKVWSFLDWFIWSGPYFAFRYPLDKRHFYKRLQSRSDVAMV